MLLQPADPEITDRKSDKTSEYESHAVPDVAPVGGHQRSEEREQAERHGRKQRTARIVEIVQEDDLCIKQKQYKIPDRQTRIDLQNRSAEAVRRQDDHTEQIHDNRDNELDTHQIQKLRRKLPEHAVLRIFDIAPASAGDRLRVRLVAPVEMHLHAGDKNDRRRDIRKHRDTRCQIVRRCVDKAFGYDHAQIRVPEHEVMHVKSQCIQEIDRHKLPVFLEILEHFFVAVAVLLEVSPDRCRLKHRRQEEAAGQSEQHAVRDVAVAAPHEKKRHQKREHHSEQEVE